MGHKIVVDREKCIGCGACAATCPKSFVMKDGKSLPVNSSVEKLSCEKEAETNCPVNAISVS